ARGAGGEDDDRVVGGGAAVDGDGVEGVGHRSPQQLGQLVGGDGGVGGEHGEHRRHVRGQHRGPLGHPADGEAVARDEDLLGPGVGGHDRLGGPVAGRLVVAPPRHQRADPAAHGVHRQAVADEAGAAHEHLVGRAAELLGDEGRGLLGVLGTLQAGGGVGAAAVEDDRRRPAPGAGQVGGGGDDRRRGEAVLGEDGGRRDGDAVGGGDEAQVEVAGGLDPAGDAVGGEAGDRKSVV